MVKQRVKLLVVVAMVGLIGLGGCKKCYECASAVGRFICHKNVDSVYLLIGGTQYIIDSLSHYHSLGYSCDTIKFYYTSSEFYNNPLCSRNGYEGAIERGDKCQELK